MSQTPTKRVLNLCDLAEVCKQLTQISPRSALEDIRRGGFGKLCFICREIRGRITTAELLEYYEHGTGRMGWEGWEAAAV
jgi:hypothetical protein